jgi:hypothetical protein
MAKTIDTWLVSLGGRDWQRGAHHRVYVGVELACKIVGLKITRYGSGNISSATLKGETISNSSARSYLCDLENCYYDVVSGKFVGSTLGLAATAREQFAAQGVTDPVV